MGKTKDEKKLILPAQKVRRGVAGYAGKNVQIVGDKAAKGQPKVITSGRKR